jgi:chromosome partitioning protein
MAGELARQAQEKGMKITLIDADPNQHSADWAKKSGCPANLELIENSTEDSILDDIDKAEQETSFVIVDLEGTASIAVASAISRADLVVVMAQASENDAKEALKTVKLIFRQGRLLNRDIPYSILLTRVSPSFATRNYKNIKQQFIDLGLQLFKAELIDRAAYVSVLSFGGPVHLLDTTQVPGVSKAADNVVAVVKEVKQRLAAALGGGGNG